MLTIDDVRAVPLFSKLALPELERLARTSADLHLATGEYAAHEGGRERALYAVLSGKIEVVRSFDGVERTLGWRRPGVIFGELPIALGTPLYGSYRAAEPSRVMRVEIQEYYAIAAVRRHDSGGVFVFIGADAETGWLPADIARDARGYVLTGDDVVKAGRWSHDRDPYLLESSVPGVFACGDVRLSPVRRVASAVGEGSMAISFVHNYLQQDAR